MRLSIGKVSVAIICALCVCIMGGCSTSESATGLAETGGDAAQVEGISSEVGESADLETEEEAAQRAAEQRAAEEAAAAQAEAERQAAEAAAAQAEAERKAAEADQVAEAQKNASTVYITDTGKKYHANGCRHLKKSKIAISLSDARAQGYEPCSVCNP